MASAGSGSFLRRRPLLVAGAVLALIVVLVGAAVVVVANPFGAAPADAADDTIWSAISSQVRNGQVAPAVALEGFAYVFNISIPGVRVPAGRDADAPTDGDVVTRWVQADWDSFTPDQQAVIAPILTPGTEGTTLQIALPSSVRHGELRADVANAQDDPVEGPAGAGAGEAVPAQALQDAVKADLLADVAHIGQRLGMSTISQGASLWKNITLVFSNQSHGGTLFTTFASTNGAGIYSPCNVVAYPIAWQGEQATNGRVSDRLHVLITHEVVHCYQNVIWGSTAVAKLMPDFITEGTALWLAADDTRIVEVMVPLSLRVRYFYDPEQPLTNRTYDAYGYYALLNHLGRDMWSLMVPAWQSAKDGEVANGDPSNPFIAALNGDADDVRNAWAPSLLRQSSWGDPWIAYAFGLPDDAQVTRHAVVAYLDPGFLGDVNSRANTVDEVESSEGEIVLVQTDGVASAHDGAGHNDPDFTSKKFCVSGDCVCPPGTAHAGERMADDDMQLPFIAAFNAGFGGSHYRIVGRSLADECGQPDDNNPFPSGGGGNGAGATSGSGDLTCGTGCAGSNGDPHLRTVNNVYYDLQAAGEFTLLRSNDGSLEIQARQQPFEESDHIAINTAVAARDNGHRVGVYMTDNGLSAKVDGTAVPIGTPPVDLGNGAAVTSHAGGYEIDFPDGTQLWALPVGNYGINAQVNPSDLLRRTGIGLLGAVVPGGQAVPLLANGTRLPRPADAHEAYTQVYQNLANSWRVAQAESLFDYDPGTSTATYTNTSFPSEQALNPPVQTSAALTTCAAIEDLGLREECLFDVSTTGDLSFLESYEGIASLLANGPASLDGPIGVVTGPGSTPEPTTPSGEQTPPPTMAPTPGNVVATNVDSLRGAAIGPDGTVYLSIVLSDGTTSKLLAVDPRSGTVISSVDAKGSGKLAVADGSVWAGEFAGGSDCSVTRLDAATLAVQATIDTPCDIGGTTLAASGDVFAFLDRQLSGSTQEGIRRVDPTTNGPSDPIVVPYFNGNLYGSTNGLVYGFAGQQPFYRLDNGTADLVSLGAHIEEGFPAGDGLWTLNDESSGFVADFFDSDSQQPTRSIPIDGYIEAADNHALYVSQRSNVDSSSQLWEYPTDSSLPFQVGTPPPPYGGTQFDYFTDDPLLVGQGGVAQIWHVSESASTPSALLVQWIPTQ